MITVAYDPGIFVSQARGGISRYFYEVALRLNASADFRAEIVAPLHINDYLREGVVPVRGVLAETWAVGRHLRLRRWGNWAASELLLAAIRPNVIHETYYASRRRRSRPTVLTVYDMIHERLSSYFSAKDPTSALKREAVARADVVICISEQTRSDLVELFDIPRSKTRVTHLGYALMPAKPSELRHEDNPYLLYVGHRGGYKNFGALLRAFQTSRALHRDLRIVAFGGGPITREEAALMVELGLPDNSVVFTSGDDSELATAYKNAAAFVYPSLYEGFGIPPLEAMSFDCPVICSNAGSLPEVVGDAVSSFDPANTEQLSGAINELVSSPSRRFELVQRGHARLRLFSWDRCAQQTMDIYREIAGA